MVVWTGCSRPFPLFCSVLLCEDLCTLSTSFTYCFHAPVSDPSLVGGALVCNSGGYTVEEENLFKNKIYV